MKIRTGFAISYEGPGPMPMILMLSVHPSRTVDLLTPETIVFDPPVPWHQYTDSFGNRCTRIVSPGGRMSMSADFMITDSGEPDIYAPEARQHAVEDLPDEVLPFLLGSRYCDTDRMVELAWSLFGQTPEGWARVQAICDFVHGHIVFNYQDADATRTAFDGYNQRRGVCRDYAHLAITVCRCLNIPARYCTGYLGEIRIPQVPPGDFAAWMEVYLGGRWYTFDPRNNVRRIGRIVIARGRDAADVAISTTFGRTTLVRFDVHTDEAVDAPAASAA